MQMLPLPINVDLQIPFISAGASESNKPSINLMTIGLLFLQLMNHIKRVETNEENQPQGLMIDVLWHIEEHYRDRELIELAAMLHYDVYWLSREIKKLSVKNYTELVQAVEEGK